MTLSNERPQHRRGESLYLFEDLYRKIRPKYSFSAKTYAGWASWRKRFRRELRSLLGFDLLKKYLATTVRARRVACDDCGDYVRELWKIRTFPRGEAISFVLVPKQGKSPRPALVTVHGHGEGVNTTLQLSPDGTPIKQSYTGYHHDFALQAVRNGFVVLAPEVLDFGRRRNFHWLDFAKITGSCYPTQAIGSEFGIAALGLRAWDILRQLDWFVGHPAVIPDRIGMLGLSGGGALTLYASLFDRRIRASSVCGYLTRFGSSLLRMFHCPCNYVPGQLRLGEIDDVAGLIAPKPLLVECSRTDTGFPFRASRRAVEKLKRIYKVAGKEKNLEIDFFDGAPKFKGHEFHGKKTWKFFNQYLET